MKVIIIGISSDHSCATDIQIPETTFEPQEAQCGPCIIEMPCLDASATQLLLLKALFFLSDPVDYTFRYLHHANRPDASNDIKHRHLGEIMSQAPHEVYAKQLAIKKNGYPLWRPDPHDEPPVEIADVGYVEKGKFIRLFNASKALGDEGNREGVPDHYSPLQVGKIAKDTLSAGFPMMSKNVTQLGGQLEISSGGGAAGFSFECEKGQGAVLVLGDYADVQDALDKKSFLLYIRNNYQAWLDFAEKRLITLGDLVLVTGCDKTSAWACATISGRSVKVSLKVLAGQGVLQGGLGIWASWDECQSVDAHSGPQVAVRSIQGPKLSNETNVIEDATATTNDVTATSRESIFMQIYFSLVALIMHYILNRVLMLRSDFDQHVLTENTSADLSPERAECSEIPPDSPRSLSYAQDMECINLGHGQSRTTTPEHGCSHVLGEDQHEIPLRTQCIFVRGFKLLDRTTWRQKLRLKKDYDGFDYVERKGDSDSSGRRSALSSPRGSASNGGSTGSSGLSTHSSGSSGGRDRKLGRSSENSGAWREHSPGRESTDYGLASNEEDPIDDLVLYMQLNWGKEVSPLDIVLDFILENSAVELALVHDDDLTDLNLTGDLDSFVKCINERAPKIYVHDQVGMLYNTYQVSISVGGGFNPENKNSQTGIPIIPPALDAMPSKGQKKVEYDGENASATKVAHIPAIQFEAPQLQNEDIKDELEHTQNMSQKISPPPLKLRHRSSRNSLVSDWSSKDRVFTTHPRYPVLGSNPPSSPILNPAFHAETLGAEKEKSPPSFNFNGMLARTIDTSTPSLLEAPPEPTLSTMTRDKLDAELMDYRHKTRQLEFSLDLHRLRVAELEKVENKAPIQGPSSFRAPIAPIVNADQWPEPLDWHAGTAAPLKSLFTQNREGNALCAWHSSRRERRVYPPGMAPPNMLNCGCTYAEGLFEESLARNHVGAISPGSGIRMDPALRNPLLKLLQERYEYRDGDFELLPNGDWRVGDDSQSWNQHLDGKRHKSLPDDLGKTCIPEQHPEEEWIKGNDTHSWDQQTHENFRFPSSNLKESTT